MHSKYDVKMPTRGNKLSQYVAIAIYTIVLATIFGFGLYHTTLKYIF